MSEFDRLRKIVAQLRAPGGCPWDREQTTESLLPALLEEAYEVVGAVRGRDNANLREELGDLLLVIVMQAEIAEEEKQFTIDDVLREVTEKLIRRHPHVFGASEVRGSEGVLRQWEAIKRSEKQDEGHFLDRLPAALPALMRAQKVQKKVARVNFDWPSVREVTAKVEEEWAETKKALAAAKPPAIAEEIGDLLFAVVNLARKCDFDAETLLQAAIQKFVQRFDGVEDRLRQRGGSLGKATLAELDAIWNELKRERPLAG